MKAHYRQLIVKVKNRIDELDKAINQINSQLADPLHKNADNHHWRAKATVALSAIHSKQTRMYTWINRKERMLKNTTPAHSELLRLGNEYAMKLKAGRVMVSKSHLDSLQDEKAFHDEFKRQVKSLLGQKVYMELIGLTKERV